MSETTSNDTPQTEQISITLNDLKNMLMVIDVCTQRGAFRGNELTSIGQLNDRITAFVADAEAKMTPPADAEGAAEGASEPVAPASDEPAQA